MRRFWSVAALIVLVATAGCSGAAGEAPSERQRATAASPAVTAGVETEGATCLPDSRRATFSEIDPTDDEVLTQVFHEVSPDHVWVEQVALGRHLVVIGDRAWTIEDGTWTELPIVPVRPLRLPWVNNFVTGHELMSGLQPVESRHQHGVPTNRFQPSFTEMVERFPDRFRGREIDSTSTFDYWIDGCGTIVSAEITMVLTGEEETIAAELDLPTAFLYRYELTDVGGHFKPIVPLGSLPDR